MIVHADCRDHMRTMDADSVDAVVTDPPYGISFMGKGWDYAVPGVEFWQEAYRVLKPGAYLLAFGGTRMFHRMAVAIEDAGFEIRDTLSWLYGSGFPKSHDVGKAIDKAAGADREVIGPSRSNGLAMKPGKSTFVGEFLGERPKAPDITAPTTDAAKQWDGWGTALKPAWEPIIVARKPLEGTVANNVLTHGTGAINVDACRIGTNGEAYPINRFDDGAKPFGGGAGHAYTSHQHTAGRWPANVVLDEVAAELLDQQSEVQRSRKAYRGGSGWKALDYSGRDDLTPGQMTNNQGYEDTGGASRFFYTAKASRRERNAGLEGMPERVSGGMAGTADQTLLTGSGNIRNNLSTNPHPTVKPISLMRWLVRLVTPPGGIVLDPFAGSGTTGCAAALEGFEFIGIEQSAEYVEIAERRIAHWRSQSR